MYSRVTIKYPFLCIATFTTNLDFLRRFLRQYLYVMDKNIHGHQKSLNDHIFEGYLLATAELKATDELPYYFKKDPEIEKKDGTKIWVPVGTMRDYEKARISDLGFVFPSNEFMASIEKCRWTVVNVVIPSGWSIHKEDVYTWVADQQGLVHFRTCIDLSKFYDPSLLYNLEYPWELRPLGQFIDSYRRNTGQIPKK